MHYTVTQGTKALIFDLDGTLADTMPFHMKAWQMACKDFGIDMTSDFLRSMTGTPARKIAEAIILNNNIEKSVSPDQLFKRKIDIFFSMHEMVKEVKPVADIVRKYHGLLPMAIGTGGFNEAVYRTLDVIGMKKYFDVIVTSNDVNNHKPDPETFLQCSRLMDTDPAFITVFEDGDLGIEAARRAGMPTDRAIPPPSGYRLRPSAPCSMERRRWFPVRPKAQNVVERLARAVRSVVGRDLAHRYLLSRRGG